MVIQVPFEIDLHSGLLLSKHLEMKSRIDFDECLFYKILHAFLAGSSKSIDRVVSTDLEFDIEYYVKSCKILCVY